MRNILEFCNCPKQIVNKFSSPTFQDVKNSILKAQVDKLQTILQEGAPLTNKTQNALHYAVNQKNIAIVKYLTEKYPQMLQERNDEGDTPFMVSIFNQTTEIVEYLLPVSNLSARDNNGNTPLIIASANGLVKIVDKILQRLNNTIIDRNFQGQTALHRACYYGQIQVAILLIKKTGMKFNQADKRGNNSLHFACLGLNIRMVQYIVNLVKNQQKLMTLNKENKKPFELMVQIINKIEGKNSSVSLNNVEQKIYHNISLPIAN